MATDTPLRYEQSEGTVRIKYGPNITPVEYTGVISFGRQNSTTDANVIQELTDRVRRETQIVEEEAYPTVVGKRISEMAEEAQKEAIEVIRKEKARKETEIDRIELIDEENF